MLSTQKHEFQLMYPIINTSPAVYERRLKNIQNTKGDGSIYFVNFDTQGITQITATYYAHGNYAEGEVKGLLLQDFPCLNHKLKKEQIQFDDINYTFSALKKEEAYATQTLTISLDE